MLVLAHRGARREAPENTVEAFRAARRRGADGVELDVHRTADDGLVVHHDADAPGLGVLAERTRAEIRASMPSIPDLAEVLDVCARMLVNVEIKNSPGDSDHDPRARAADLVTGLLASRGGSDDVIVSSFDLPTVDRVRELAPSLPTGFLSFGLDPFDVLELGRSRGHTAVHPDAGTLGPVAGDVVARARAFGIDVNTWTVNDPAMVRALRDAGVHAVITDVPEVALRALGRPTGPPA